MSLVHEEGLGGGGASLTSKLNMQILSTLSNE